MALKSKKSSEDGSGAYKLTMLSKETDQEPLELKGASETDRDQDPDPEETMTRKSGKRKRHEGKP